MGLACGLKLTHDGAVALLDGSTLVACHEVEKRGNNLRYSELTELSFIQRVLDDEGVAPNDVGTVTVDGWRSATSPLTRHATDGRPIDLAIASYGDERPFDIHHQITAPVRLVPGFPDRYTSCTHLAGHVAASYSTSTFALQRSDAYVVVWDGGTPPRLYHVTYGSPTVRLVRVLGGLYGSAYSVFPLYFEPFRRPASQLARREVGYSELGVAGRAMAYAGLGEARPEYLAVLRELISQAFHTGGSWEASFELVERFLKHHPSVTPEDAIASFDRALGDDFVERLVDALRGVGGGRRVNVCLAGGCGLNLRWNANIRALAEVADVWVPPFTNDSGSAIGAVTAERTSRLGAFALDWDVYRGPLIRGHIESDVVQSGHIVSTTAGGWSRTPCSPDEVGALLHATGEPVVVLNGRAELGPRALGNRSILCAPHSAARERINAIKGREWYRPVAPICLEEYSREIFSPGCPDPYMLFRHTVRPAWRDRIPAVTHVDGSARLQTVTYLQNAAVSRILQSYFAKSGVPVLCNSSANLPGRGFFPDIESALVWARVPYVWADGYLYRLVGHPCARAAIGDPIGTV